MYIGIKVHDVRVRHMEFEEIDADYFRFGDEVSRAVHDAAVCVAMGQEGITLNRVLKAKETLGLDRVYMIDFVVNKVELRVAFTISMTSLADKYEWIVNDSEGFNKKLTVIRNFIITQIVNFNKGIKINIFND